MADLVVDLFPLSLRDPLAVNNLHSNPRQALPLV